MVGYKRSTKNQQKKSGNNLNSKQDKNKIHRSFEVDFLLSRCSESSFAVIYLRDSPNSSIASLALLISLFMKLSFSFPHPLVPLIFSLLSYTLVALPYSTLFLPYNLITDRFRCRSLSISCLFRFVTSVYPPCQSVTIFHFPFALDNQACLIFEILFSCSYLFCNCTNIRLFV